MLKFRGSHRILTFTPQKLYGITQSFHNAACCMTCNEVHSTVNEGQHSLPNLAIICISITMASIFTRAFRAEPKK